MDNLIVSIVIILASELVAIFCFWLLSGLNPSKTRTISGRGVMKGIAERAFIAFSLVNGLPHSLTLFAALKIATRIRDDDHISNDFYLLGNILSITLAIVYSQLILKL